MGIDMDREGGSQEHLGSLILYRFRNRMQVCGVHHERTTVLMFDDGYYARGSHRVG